MPSILDYIAYSPIDTRVWITVINAFIAVHSSPSGTACARIIIDKTLYNISDKIMKIGILCFTVKKISTYTWHCPPLWQGF